MARSNPDAAAKAERHICAHHEYNRWKVVTQTPVEREIADRTVAFMALSEER
jgi:hypothetical protein